MDLVAGLVARSLVVAEDSGVGTRYRLLETIRQYGEERLADSRETAELQIRHAAFYARFSAHAAEKTYGPEQLVWARRIHLERDNFLTALANAIDSGDASAAIALVASYPVQARAESPTGEVLVLDVAPVLAMPGASEHPGYPSALVVGAYKAQSVGDWQRVDELCRQARKAEKRLGAHRGPSIEMETRSLQAQSFLARGAYSDAVSAYAKAAEVAEADGYLGMAAIYWAYKVSSALLGGSDAKDLRPTVEESVTLARRSGMPGAVVISLNSMAMSLAEREPDRAKAVLNECVVRASTPGQEVATGFLMAALVATRLGEWQVALALAARTMVLWRWVQSLMAAGPSLGVCARALAEDKPEVAGVLRGAAYAAFRQQSTGQSAPGDGSRGPGVNYLLEALREAGDIVAAALGEERRQQLRAQGAAMTLDEAVSYALAHVDPSLLTGPITMTQD
jgi:hypothetical protein